MVCETYPMKETTKTLFSPSTVNEKFPETIAAGSATGEASSAPLAAASARPMVRNTLKNFGVGPLSFFQ